MSKIIFSGDWITRLAKVPAADVDVLTYSFDDDMDALHKLLRSRRGKTRIVANERFRKQAYLLVVGKPRLSIRLLKDLHAKLVIVRTPKVTQAVTGSPNLGRSSWREIMAVHSDAASVGDLAAYFEKCWSEGIVVPDLSEGRTLEGASALVGDFAQKVGKEQTTRALAFRKAASKAQQARWLNGK